MSARTVLIQDSEPGQWTRTVNQTVRNNKECVTEAEFDEQNKQSPVLYKQILKGLFNLLTEGIIIMSFTPVFQPVDKKPRIAF